MFMMENDGGSGAVNKCNQHTYSNSITDTGLSQQDHRHWTVTTGSQTPDCHNRITDTGLSQQDHRHQTVTTGSQTLDCHNRITDTGVVTCNEKLSCHRETARRFVSLNILLSHSRPFEMTLLSRACVSPYSFIKTMSVSCTVMRYSASKNGVTLKLGVGSFKVIENGAVR